MNEQILYVPLEQIRPNPYQMRKVEDAETVAEIAASIRKSGLLEKPSAREVDGGYELVFGHTRLAAFRLLAGSGEPDAGEYASMPLTIVDGLDNRQMFELGVAENVKRRDLNAIELAEALKLYMEQFEATSKEAGELFGLNESTVRGKVRLLELQPSIRELLVSGELPESAGRQLVALERLDKQKSAEAVEEILQGEVPSTAVKRALISTQAVHMHASFDDDGQPSGGTDLWRLSLKMSEFPVELLPELTTKQMSLANSPETAEQFDVLRDPPACTACPFYTRISGDHYCGLPACHERKTVAWRLKLLDETSEKLKIKVLDPKTDKDPLGFRGYDNGHKALFQKRSPDLRLKLGKPIGYWRTGDLPEGLTFVIVGETAAKIREGNKKAATRQSGTGSSSNDAAARAEEEKQQALRGARREAIQAFFLKEAYPLFRKSLQGLASLPVQVVEYIDDNFYSAGTPEKRPGSKATMKEKAGYMQGAIAWGMVFEDGLDQQGFEHSDGPLTKAANWLNQAAKEWGVKLPANLVAKAKAADDAASVSAETAARAQLKQAAKVLASPAKAGTKPASKAAAKKAGGKGAKKGGKK